MNICWADDFNCEKNYIYFSRSYQELFARIYHSELRYLKINYLEKNYFIPLILRKLKKNNYEAFSSYGYGGFVGEEINFSELQIKSLIKFLSKEYIHSLFIRHSPFLDNHNFWPKNMIEANRITYITDLFEFEDFILYKENLNQKIRSSVNHAEKNNYSVNCIDKPLESSLKDFYKLYILRMKELSVSKFYLFDYRLFKDHFDNLSDRCKLITIKNSDSELVSGAIFLCDPNSKIVYYHLSASSKEALKHQCNELMISYAKFFFGKNGFKKMFLGGGIKLDESDGLSKFKRKFCNDKKIFYITKLICDLDLYSKTRKSFEINSKEFFLIGDALEST
tara:strand:- start:2635 stop:3642 length:1008 start_codon:yes stop_codon:yes gene_type:complete